MEWVYTDFRYFERYNFFIGFFWIYCTVVFPHNLQFSRYASLIKKKVFSYNVTFGHSSVCLFWIYVYIYIYIYIYIYYIYIYIYIYITSGLCINLRDYARLESVIYVSYHIKYSIILNKYQFVKATQYHHFCILFYMLFYFRYFRTSLKSSPHQ